MAMEAAERALYAELRQRGIADVALGAMARVPRELFAPDVDLRTAYLDEPLPLPDGQTISQPFVVGRMVELLELRAADRVLDVGGGSGWHAAVIAQLAAHVWSIERHASLVALARANLARAGVENVTVVQGDGTLGWPAEAPYDAINVAAGARHRVPAALEEQLADGGRLVAPVDDQLVLECRHGDVIERQDLEGVRFVPLVGAC
jgi:protein-L-isoaspartate(D-aspartate) O-methyltransferase